MTENVMVGWHHRLNGHEFERTLGDGKGQESLVCCCPWGSKESDTTYKLSNTTNRNHTLRAYINISGGSFSQILSESGSL